MYIWKLYQPPAYYDDGERYYIVVANTLDEAREYVRNAIKLTYDVAQNQRVNKAGDIVNDYVIERLKEFDKDCIEFEQEELREGLIYEG